MSDTDELVKAWLKQRFLDGATRPSYSPVAHGEPDEIEVISTDMGWDCGCYSSWTRDDSFILTGTIKDADGDEVQIRYGRWGDFPRFIEELDAFKDNEACYYESEDYDG